MAAPDFDLDDWLPAATVRVAHSRASTVAPDDLWRAACSVRLDDSALLGHLVRWRIPGLAADLSFDEMFRADPFFVLLDGRRALVSGLVGRIWTFHRDYPQLSHPDQFREWGARGTARVLFANWVQPSGDGGAVLHSETRVHAIGGQARLGVATLRPVVKAFQQLIATNGIEEAVQRAEAA
jgi:hypothetical protein